MEIVKIQCDICEKIWDPEDNKTATGILTVFRTGMALDPKDKQYKQTVVTEKTWLCDECISKFFNIQKIKTEVQDQKDKPKEEKK